MRDGPFPFERLTRCPVCSGTNIVTFRKRTFDVDSFSENNIKITDSDYGKVWDLDRCDSCTHVFANPAPKPAFIHSLYTRTEDPDYEEEASGRGKNFLGILKTLEKIHPKKGTLLDVGAATGILMHLARKKGWDTEGIEPSSWAVAVAKEKYGLTLMDGGLETVALKSQFYTAVTLVDFIEHISHPLPALAKIHDSLVPGGTICLVTPDIQSLAANAMGKAWWHFRLGHLAYFSKKSLLTLLDRSGFRVLRWRRYVWTFSAHYLLTRVSFLKWLVKNPKMTLFWKTIPIKLALRDSFEVYAKKENSP
ncbi:MAG: class I SAM-dependent methyltransferase [Candidatus Aminicenantes bacterium]|jgi:2-polyprenyl-3-methyl-5-hydroxy-6-metoxy-1,4-benzoquinol methylase